MILQNQRNSSDWRKSGIMLGLVLGNWKLLRGNDIVYKLRRFVDFGVPLNYYFGLRTFPVSAAQIVANG